MKRSLVIILISLTCTFGYVSSQLTDNPIIGILSQEYYGNGFVDVENSYIAASYVKFVEGAGGRVVPIMIDQDEEYMKNIFKSINGILMPGGSVYFNDSGYARTGKYLYDLAVEANKNGDYFPLWGTCLGFEFMLYAANDGRELRTPCTSYNVADKLKFTAETMGSRLFGKAPKPIIRTLSTQKVAVNFHHYCITEKNFTDFGLGEEYKILSLNFDAPSNLTFISSVESKKYPFYAVQFHPEKNIYEWTTKETLPHSREAIESAQYFANFFINEARRNSHRFASEEEELKNLIYNFIPTYSGAKGSTFIQQYYFKINK